MGYPEREMATTKTVLVADDDPALRKLVSQVLSRSYTIREAADGNEAIAVLREVPPPDLVVLDVMMPGKNGFEVARAAKALKSSEKVPIVFLTTKSSVEDVLQGLGAGARYYMTKPFKTEDLVAKIKKILGQ